MMDLRVLKDKTLWSAMLTCVGIILVMADVLPQTQWDEISMLVMSVLTTVFGWGGATERQALIDILEEFFGDDDEDDEETPAPAEEPAPTPTLN